MREFESQSQQEIGNRLSRFLARTREYLRGGAPSEFDIPNERTSWVPDVTEVILTEKDAENSEIPDNVIEFRIPQKRLPRKDTPTRPVTVHNAIYYVREDSTTA